MTTWVKSTVGLIAAISLSACDVDHASMPDPTVSDSVPAVMPASNKPDSGALPAPNGSGSLLSPPQAKTGTFVATPGNGETQLSSWARNVKVGMTRTAVIALLGSPTWAVLSTDGDREAIPDSNISFVLYWKNPGCNTVIVEFDRDGRAAGWDEGRMCYPEWEINNLEDKYLCRSKGRSSKCR
jgi:hypothetical protein